MSKKLKIIGPYTPEHKGPFCTRDGNFVRLLTRTDGSEDYPIVGFISNEATPLCWTDRGFCFASGSKNALDLMNAVEVPVAREFWLNEYSWGFGPLKTNLEDALQTRDLCQFIRTIHVREVLPEEEDA